MSNYYKFKLRCSSSGRPLCPHIKSTSSSSLKHIYLYMFVPLKALYRGNPWAAGKKTWRISIIERNLTYYSCCSLLHTVNDSRLPQCAWLFQQPFLEYIKSNTRALHEDVSLQQMIPAYQYCPITWLSIRFFFMLHLYVICCGKYEPTIDGKRCMAQHSVPTPCQYSSKLIWSALFGMFHTIAPQIQSRFEKVLQ